MAESAARSTGRIFISYRRDEAAYPAGWLYDRLAGQYGSAQVFKDIDSIKPGDDFVHVITRAVASCDVLLALIGAQWLTATNEQGRRRLDDPEDFVRLEIEAAMSRDVPTSGETARLAAAEGDPVKRANRRRTVRRALMIGGPLAALLVSYLTIQFLVPALTASPGNGDTQSSVTGEITEDAPWRLVIRDDGASARLRDHAGQQ